MTGFVTSVLLLLSSVCLLPTALAGYYGPLDTKTGLSDAAKQYILCEHNRIRAAIATATLPWSQPKASNMQCLCWCDELVPKAQTHASNCGGPSHDVRSGRATLNFRDVGQSLMDCMKSAPVDEAIDAFVEEANGYNLDANSCDSSKAGRAGVCGHYTALAWAHTQCIGCAYDECSGHANGRLVCNYGPGGNIAGERPYVSGEPCTNCYPGEKCVDSALCCDCSSITCGGSVEEASSGTCADANSQCALYESYVGVCSSESSYYAWAGKNCAKTCNLCGGINTGKICNKAFNVSNDYCKTFDSATAPNCVKGNGLFYASRLSKTASGHTCSNWSAQTKYHDFEFPERNRTLASNYCRNPGGSGSKPWCYTTGTSVGWEYCSLPGC